MLFSRAGELNGSLAQPESAFSESLASRFSCDGTAMILQSEQNVSKNSHRRTMAYHYTDIHSDPRTLNPAYIVSLTRVVR
jgi:hypothetical protein